MWIRRIDEPRYFMYVPDYSQIVQISKRDFTRKTADAFETLDVASNDYPPLVDAFVEDHRISFQVAKAQIWLTRRQEIIIVPR